jgi:hypothetical protein
MPTFTDLLNKYTDDANIAAKALAKTSIYYGSYSKVYQ